MKNYILICLCSIFLCTAYAQDQNFQRKGRLLLETGIGGPFNNSGLNVLSIEGNSQMQIAMHAGYFTSERFALKFNLGISNSDDFLFGNITSINFGVGAKYYIIDRIPVEAAANIWKIEDASEFLLSLNAGYAFKLAENILLEPALGYHYTFEDISILRFRVNFALIL